MTPYIALVKNVFVCVKNVFVYGYDSTEVCVTNSLSIKNLVIHEFAFR